MAINIFWRIYSMADYYGRREFIETANRNNFPSAESKLAERAEQGTKKPKNQVSGKLKYHSW